MGLDTSHDCWHGAYSAFSRFRNEIARAAGYEVWPVQYDGGVHYDTVMIEWHRYRGEQMQGEWAETPSDPLIVLIAHSDCDGVIHPAQAVPLADRLEELLPAIAKLENEQDATGGVTMTKTEDGGIAVTRHPGHIAARGGMVKCTEKFIAGLRAAAAAGEDVDFH